jgi:uncharacterized membrane protein YgdD (TMEM256/DUF423 family)
LIKDTFVKKKKHITMDKKIISTGAVLGMLAIILGAFGAHALKKVLAIEQLSTFETGVRYQTYHALFLLFIGMMGSLTQKAKKTIYYLVLFGVILFSGSIYLLAISSISPIDFKTIGFVTPIGGLLLILAWGLLLLNISNKKS